MSDGYVLLDGSGHISTPDADKWTPTETQDLRIDYSLTDATPSTLMVLMAHWHIGNGGQRSWMWDVQPTSATKPGNFNTELANADGSAFVGNFAALATSDRLPTDDNERAQFRQWFDVDNGNSEKECRYYRADLTDKITHSTWTEIGTQTSVTQSGVHTFHNSTDAVRIGANNNGTGNLLVGKVYQAAIYVDGVLVADPDFRSDTQKTSDTTFTDSFGNVWTLQGSAEWVQPSGRGDVAISWDDAGDVTVTWNIAGNAGTAVANKHAGSLTWAQAGGN